MSADTRRGPVSFPTIPPMMTPSATAVVGLQWGDEGKGKIVDLLAADHDLGHVLVELGQRDHDARAEPRAEVRRAREHPAQVVVVHEVAALLLQHLLHRIAPGMVTTLRIARPIPAY